MDAHEKLEVAIADLETIKNEHAAKVNAAQVAFDKDPTEKNAEKLGAVERVAKLYIERANRKITEAENEIVATNRAELEKELEEISAGKAEIEGKISAFIDRATEIELSRIKLDKEVETYLVGVSFAQVRAAEIRAEINESKLGEGAVLSVSNVSPYSAQYRYGVIERVKEARRSPLNAMPESEVKRLEEIREKNPQLYAGIQRVIAHNTKSPLDGDSFGVTE